MDSNVSSSAITLNNNGLSLLAKSILFQTQIPNKIEIKVIAPQILESNIIVRISPNVKVKEVLWKIRKMNSKLARSSHLDLAFYQLIPQAPRNQNWHSVYLDPELYLWNYDITNGDLLSLKKRDPTDSEQFWFKVMYNFGPQSFSKVIKVSKENITIREIYNQVIKNSAFRTHQYYGLYHYFQTSDNDLQPENNNNNSKDKEIHQIKTKIRNLNIQGVWLDESKPFEYYGMKGMAVIEFKEKPIYKLANAKLLHMPQEEPIFLDATTKVADLLKLITCWVLSPVDDPRTVGLFYNPQQSRTSINNVPISIISNYVDGQRSEASSSSSSSSEVAVNEAPKQKQFWLDGEKEFGEYGFEVYDRLVCFSQNGNLKSPVVVELVVVQTPSTSSSSSPSFQKENGERKNQKSEATKTLQLQPGEHIIGEFADLRYLTLGSSPLEAYLILTTYQLIFAQKCRNYFDYSTSIPLGFIYKVEKVENGEKSYVEIQTKDLRFIRILFSSSSNPSLSSPLRSSPLSSSLNAAISEEKMLREKFYVMLTDRTFPRFFHDIYAFQFPSSSSSSSQHDDDSHRHHNLSLIKENEKKANIETTNEWRVSDINAEYEFCPTYPSQIVVPSTITDESLRIFSQFRMKRRVPIMSYHHHSNHAVICCSSIPKLKTASSSSSSSSSASSSSSSQNQSIIVNNIKYENDEIMLEAIRVANTTSEVLYIFDSRTKPPTSSSSSSSSTSLNITTNSNNNSNSSSNSSNNNSGASGVTSFPPSSYASNSFYLSSNNNDIITNNNNNNGNNNNIISGNGSGGGGGKYRLEYLGLEHISYVRECFWKLMKVCEIKVKDDRSFYLALENSQWLSHVKALLIAASRIVRAVDIEASSVIIQCPEGWDRSIQLTSLSQLLLDPKYRTIDGFQRLIEQNWVSFGHPFSLRCSMLPRAFGEDQKDHSPIFLQFLDAVYQLISQFPCDFEFNEKFLIHIMDGMYSLKYGTFLLNNERSRMAWDLHRHTQSIWDDLHSNREVFVNPFYRSNHSSLVAVLYPSTLMSDITIWSNYYFRWLRNSQSMYSGVSLEVRGWQMQSQIQTLQKLIADLQSSSPPSLSPESSST